jgi:glutathione S-transferase
MFPAVIDMAIRGGDVHHIWVVRDAGRTRPADPGLDAGAVSHRNEEQMDKLKLYHNDMSVCAAKVRMALAEKGLEWEGVHMNLRAGDAHKPDYVKLNPGRVVPTLVHEGWPLIESNVICEYLDEVWPEPSLRPESARGRARMRLWMKQLDESVHAATGTVSACIAFRFQHLKRDPAELKAWIENLEPTRRERTKHSIELGMDAPEFVPAVKRFLKLVADMDAALQDSHWLAGDTFSLADLAYASYMARLIHLGLHGMVTERPKVADWRARLFARPSYKSGIEDWFNPSYIEIFDRQRGLAQQRLARIQ